jgi:asparagine synthase (glutamine-hydrolysing)
MAHAVGHRGPDGEEILLEGPAGLAFRRLALIGPDNGTQPLFSEDGSIALIANGEVYNHRDLEKSQIPDVTLRTKSDCEVLAHLYAREGRSFLDQVAGMFAIALWDRKRQTLVLARDRFGIKPLYYIRAGNQVTFASEIKALFQHPECPRSVDWDLALGEQTLTVAPFLSQEPAMSWFSGIEMVPAGSIVTIDLVSGRAERHDYWKLPDFDGQGSLSDAELVTAYRELLAESVRDCATADAELGLFLSGGIDSAAVAALAVGNTLDIHTFTVANGSTFANGDAEYSHRAAKWLGLRNHQVLLDSSRMPTPGGWKDLLWLLETPLCGPEQHYKFQLHRFAKSVRPELRGMLLGQASDEYNGGYSTVLSNDGTWQGFEVSMQRMARSADLLHSPAMSPWMDAYDEPLISDAVLTGDEAEVLADPYGAYVAWKHRSIQQYNCWHEDRTAAGNGIEARVPFLDHRIIELLATIPKRQRATLLWDKQILRRAVSDVLPDDIVRRPKVPFYYGPGEGFTHRAMVALLSRDQNALLEEALSSPGGHNYLRAGALRNMLSRLRGTPNPADIEILLRLVNLGLLDQMTRSLPRAPLDSSRGGLPISLDVVEWEPEEREIGNRVGYYPDLALDDVLRFSDGVAAVCELGTSTLYLAIDGQFEFVVEESEEPEWYRFLSAVDGKRRIEALLTQAHVDLSDVTPLLAEALNAGLLVLTTEPLSEETGATEGECDGPEPVL